MEQLLVGILNGDLDAASLLLLFIIGILTKRFVPWWIHEEVLEKLKEYEDAAPELLDEITTLIETIEASGRASDPVVRERVSVIKRKEALNDLQRTVHPRRRKRVRTK